MLVRDAGAVREPAGRARMATASAAKAITLNRTVFEPRTSPKSPPYRTQSSPTCPSSAEILLQHSETAPRAAPGPMSGIDERVVAVRSLFSPPFPLAPLLPTLEVAGGTAVDMGRWSPPCAATDSRFRGGG